MKSESKRPVTIEDLLHLKRAERPPAEFWAEFDRKLREKQLAALVAKRPWWQTLPGTLSAGFVRYRIPLGAAAAVAITVVSLQQAGRKASPSPAQEAIAAEAAVPAAPLVGGPASDARLAEASVPVAGEATQVAALTPTLVEKSPEATLVASDPITASELSRLVALGGVAAEKETDAQPAVSRTFASGMMVARNVESVSAPRFLGEASSGFESRVMPARAAVEPLQQMTPPSESRRSRIMTAMVSTAVLDNSARTTERAASRIAEERLYDQIQRFSARGDGFQVKF